MRVPLLSLQWTPPCISDRCQVEGLLGQVRAGQPHHAWCLSLHFPWCWLTRLDGLQTERTFLTISVCTALQSFSQALTQASLKPTCISVWATVLPLDLDCLPTYQICYAGIRSCEGQLHKLQQLHHHHLL